MPLAQTLSRTLSTSDSPCWTLAPTASEPRLLVARSEPRKSLEYRRSLRSTSSLKGPSPVALASIKLILAPVLVMVTQSLAKAWRALAKSSHSALPLAASVSP